MTDNEIILAAQAICDALSEEQDGLKRDVLNHVGNTWSLFVIHTLGVDGRMRFSRLQERITGVSQKMLTKSLRELERDGLIARTAYMEVPPRVEYELTALGRGLLIQIIPLWTWVIEHADTFREARNAFDLKTKKQGNNI
ncbi:helix-turn-helix transcriptional regulator [Mucilaginibacter sp. HC2]|uniref:winged helix-turn-helix transcriptional regulator n=1 Tax=Mucilaginibacter inviolabilis TaxID=2714892 RepID=UPI00140E01A4|nr:helix-turn-helix domain-containing protein [Mucilaginibacter inviolabilis]NHA06436.1 helix-turn-helix transcriptional regulator [Mucilaginibacter inviolabilis]